MGLLELRYTNLHITYLVVLIFAIIMIQFTRIFVYIYANKYAFAEKVPTREKVEKEA